MQTYRNSRNITGPLVLIASGLLLLSISIWQMVMRPALAKPPMIRSVVSTAPEGNDVNIQVSAARVAYDLSQAQFLDLRDPTAYQQRHITGALNIPSSEVPQQITELNPSRWVILYSSRNNQSAGDIAVQELLGYGFIRANNLAGGFESWEDAGNPTEP